MSTHDIPDNELDDFFRKSLEKPDIDFREEDWLQMEKKLAMSVRRKAIYRRYLYSLLALLCITTIAVLVNVHTMTRTELKATSTAGQPTENEDLFDRITGVTDKNVSDSETPATHVTDDENTAASGEAANEIKTPNASTGTETLQKTRKNKDIVAHTPNTPIIIQESPNKPAIQKRNQESTPTLPSKEKRGEASTAPAGLVSSHQDIFTGKDYSAGQQIDLSGGEKLTERVLVKKSKSGANLGNTIGKIPVQAGKKPAKQNSAPGSESVVVERNEWVKSDKALVDSSWQSYVLVDTEMTEAQWPVLPLSQVRVQEFSQKNQLAEKYTNGLKAITPDGVINAVPGDSVEVKKLAKERIHYRFSLGLVFSPDISTVRLSGLTKPGTNVGILIGYQLSRKFTLSAGIIRSTKMYDAHVEDYNPPPGQWTYYIKPVEIKASCMVIDIPVNIRYALVVKQPYTIYVSAGLSSYLMLSEKYNYVYDVDDTYLRKSWEVTNENKHYFKVYNLSVGYERKVGKRFTAGAEPFVKIPGAGVGFGKIHLWTAGLFFSANYKFGQSK